MEIVKDRKAAIKKLRHLTYNSKIPVEKFREKMDQEFKTVFLPNNVERTEHQYGNVICDVLSPEIYSSNRIMLYIHGGCFTGGSRESHRAFCSSLATKCYCRVVLPEYRLAPAYPYPAAIENIQSVFKSLFTEEQVANSLNVDRNGKAAIPEIIIAADGAGASIACAFIFNLRDRYRSCISHVILFSPWLNVSQNSKIITTRRAGDEIITGDVLRKSSSDYTYATNTSSPFVSPVFAEDEQLENFPPVFIQMGGKEILLEDARLFQTKLLERGNKCVLDVWPGMMFMFQMADEYLHESHLALDKVGKVVTGDTAGSDELHIENKPKLEFGIHGEA